MMDVLLELHFARRIGHKNNHDKLRSYILQDMERTAMMRKIEDNAFVQNVYSIFSKISTQGSISPKNIVEYFMMQNDVSPFMMICRWYAEPPHSFVKDER